MDVGSERGSWRWSYTQRNCGVHQRPGLYGQNPSPIGWCGSGEFAVREFIAPDVHVIWSDKPYWKIASIARRERGADALLLNFYANLGSYRQWNFGILSNLPGSNVY